MMRVGITGHIGLNPEHLPKITACISETISLIETQYPDRTLTVFSPMALGADRLVARMLLQKEGSRLIAVLPLPKEDYINDFGTTDDHNLTTMGKTGNQLEKCVNAYSDAEMRQEFRYWLSEKAIEVVELPLTPTRDEAYLQAGNFIAENCDLMIAIWDGKSAQGTGGTGDIVGRAEKCGKPVIHIWAGNYKENPAKRTDVGEKLGTARFKKIQGLEDCWPE
jgi:hypothetical protein